MSQIITPTVGRKVWYRPSEHDKVGLGAMTVSSGQPLDATVIAVWGDRMVNVLVTDVVGKQFPVLSVVLVQEGDVKPAGRYVEWMPYQTGQARKDVAIDRVINMNTPLGAAPAPVAAAQAQSTADFLAGSKACDITDGTCEACQ